MLTATSGATSGFISGTLGQTGGDGLGQDAFLKLLIAQIQMQDPLNPVAAHDYIAQLAQFSTLEQLQTSNVQFAVLTHIQAVCQAVLLIGREITTAAGGLVGVVDGVIFVDGQPKLLVGERQIDPGDVTKVS